MESGEPVMTEIDADYARLRLHGERIVIVETKPGVLVEGSMVRKALDLIEAHIPTDYGVVIDRKNDYRLMRFEIYEEVNSREKLRGLAIVTHSKAANMLTELEAPLCRKAFAKFDCMDDAVNWARGLLSR
jgi:hypothetical protein